MERLIETEKEMTSNHNRENNLKEKVDKVTREKHVVEKEKIAVVNEVTNNTVRYWHSCSSLPCNLRNYKNFLLCYFIC